MVAALGPISPGTNGGTEEAAIGTHPRELIRLQRGGAEISHHEVEHSRAVIGCRGLVQGDAI